MIEIKCFKRTAVYVWGTRYEFYKEPSINLLLLVISINK